MQAEISTNIFNRSFVCLCCLLVAFHTIDVAAITSNTIKLIIQQCVFIVHGSKVCVISTCHIIYDNDNDN